MARYKVFFDRKNCIGAAACVAEHPEHWKLENDGKASIIGGKKVESSDNEEIIIDEKDFPLCMAAAEACPVKAIHIKDVDKNIDLI